MLEKSFELVEQVLQSFPDECKKNYYENKKTLQIKDKTNEEYVIKSTVAQYDENTNIIDLYSINTAIVIHELFHMSFRNEKNLTKQIFEDENIYYSNGIAYKIIKEGNSTISGKALTEGFVDYLTRKIIKTSGYNFEYFIVDLLISIYGEEIIKYPLTNDVIGFYSDDRFYDIFGLKKCLDQYYTSMKFIQLFVSLVMPKVEIMSDEDKRKVFKSFDDNISNYYSSIISSIKSIIKEYKHCSNPLITRSELISKLDDFIVNPDYIVNFELASLKKYDIVKDFQKIKRTIR